MTTVAFKAGVFAADQQMTAAGSVRLHYGGKIHILNPHTIYAAAGDINAIEYLKRYYSNETWNLDDKKAQKRAKLVEAILWYKGQAFTCDGDVIAVPLHAPYYAIGSGWTFALSALESGATPVEAVKFASKFDVFTNDNVQVVNVTQLEGQGQQDSKGRKKSRVSPSPAGD